MLDTNFLEYLNGPWSNAACVGYCYKAMLRAGASPDMIRAVLRKLEGCFDDYSVEEAAEIAVRTVRGWLDESESGIHVVFDVFLESDERIYRDILFG